jgi:DNA modification methylase
MKLGFKTKLGKYYLGDTVKLLDSRLGAELEGKVQLIITSPPFPLNNKKSYGNLNGREYKKWFSELAPIFSYLLKDDGSVVIELGNSWEKNRPVQSLLHLESLIAFSKNKEANFSLCQQFVCYNPARLPSPAQWVTINHIRATDSYTHVWWFGKTDKPKADTKKVLRPYSNSMKSLLKHQSYNSGKRPSEHNISEAGFLVDNGGSIPQNFFEIEPLDKSREVRLPNAFSFSNTNSNDSFLRACREIGITPHPARMPKGLVSFFVQFLTDSGDIVLDPFAGSNTTGYVAEKLKRKWISVEINKEYLVQAKLRFPDKDQP